MSKSKQYYFRCRICWYRCLQKVKVYEQTKLRRHNSSDGWDMTTSVFQKNKCPPYWKSTFGFDFDHLPEICTLFCIRLYQILSKSKHPLRKYDVISISQDGGRDGWILLPVSYLSMSLPLEGQSISKPNFVEITQMEAKIFFYGNPKWLGKGSNFFSKSRMCQYLGMFCYILWIQKCIFDACRLKFAEFYTKPLHYSTEYRRVTDGQTCCDHGIVCSMHSITWTWSQNANKASKHAILHIYSRQTYLEKLGL